MGALRMRRAEKKAQTRELIRSVAHRLFARSGFDAVTVADIAREADIAVQTVFNHFPTKEELFFDGRTDWVDGAARAVRERPEHVPPLCALREHLMSAVTGYLEALGDPDTRTEIATLEASAALRAYERELHEECVRRLGEALTETGPDDSGALAGRADGTIEPRVSASMTAAVWMAAIRALVVEHRGRVADCAGAAELSAALAALAGRVLAQFEDNPSLTPGASGTEIPSAAVTGWPASVRRTG